MIGEESLSDMHQCLATRCPEFPTNRTFELSSQRTLQKRQIDTPVLNWWTLIPGDGTSECDPGAGQPAHDHGVAAADNFAGIPFLIVPPSPVRIRRVSFSDTSIDNAEFDDEEEGEEMMMMVTDAAPEIAITEAAGARTETASSTRSRRSRCVRQASLQVGTSLCCHPLLTHYGNIPSDRVPCHTFCVSCS